MNLVNSLSSPMSLFQLQQTDQLQNENVAVQMHAEKVRNDHKIWQILEDLQTDIFKIQQEVCLNRAKVGDKMMDKWDEYFKD